MITDRTGQVVDQATAVAQSAKYKEDQLAALAWQDSSNSSLIPDASEVDAGAYYPEATQTALYRATAATGSSVNARYAYSVNKGGSPNYLLHWNNIATALQLLNSMKNYQSQYIDVFAGGPLKIIVPIALEQRAKMLAMTGAGAEIRSNDSAGTAMNILHVPDYIKAMGVSSVQVIVWKLLPSLTSTSAPNSVWYLAGASQKQFRKHQRWPTEFGRATQAQLGGDDFRRDVLFSVRAGFNAGFRAVDDKYVISNAS